MTHIEPKTSHTKSKTVKSNTFSSILFLKWVITSLVPKKYILVVLVYEKLKKQSAESWLSQT